MRRGFSPRFFVDLVAEGGSAAGTPGAGTRFALSDEDAHHARNVLRVRLGDACEVVLLAAPADPGSVSSAAIALAHFAEVGRQIWVELDEMPAPAPVDRVRVVLCQALPHPGKMDEVLEKGTEVGVAAFVLFPALGSPSTSPERLRERLPRWRRVAREAAKQSKQVALPSVTVAPSLDEAVALVTADGISSCGAAGPDAPPGPVWLVLEPSAEVAAAEALPAAVATGGVALWVGPERGWSAVELARFEALPGARVVTLGRRVLRTETAGPVVAALTHFVAGDW